MNKTTAQMHVLTAAELWHRICHFNDKPLGEAIRIMRSKAYGAKAQLKDKRARAATARAHRNK